MPNLMYNNMTDDLVTREGLSQLMTPQPRGAHHRPYPFAQFVEQVTDSIEATGNVITEEEYAVTKDGNRLFGLLAVQPQKIQVPANWRLLLGLRGSHDQAFARALTIGSQVMVCSNLCFHGDLGVWKTRQTTNIADRLGDLIYNAVNQIPAAARELVVSLESYRSTSLSENDGYLALVRMFRDRAFSPPQLGRAINEWSEPSVSEHAEDGWTVWRLFNSATQALKPTGTSGDLMTLQQRSQKVHQHVSALVH